MGNKTKSLLTAFVCIILLASQSNFAFAGSASNDDELNPERLIAEHIKSIGGPSLLASVHSRAFVGTTDVDFIQGWSGIIDTGKSMLVSDGNKLSIVLRYPSVDYPQEYFAYNGLRVSVYEISPGVRSPFADFLYRFNGIMKKGFLGGTLSLNWPLLKLQEGDVKLKFKKTKIEDRELYELEWPKSTLGDVRIRMYFEPETFHHVRTEYDVRIKNDVSQQQDYVGNMGQVVGQMPGEQQESVIVNGLALDVPAGAGGTTGGTPGEDIIGFSNMMDGGIVQDVTYKLVETFDDFKKESGMTLPHKYDIQFESDNGNSATIMQWTIKAVKFTFNKKYDDKIFRAYK